MKLWRLGIGVIPAGYVEHHENEALANLAKLVKTWGVEQVAHPRLVPAGWCDGMSQLRAIVRTRVGRTLLLQWSDDEAGGCFYVDGGHGRTRLGASHLQNK